MPDEGAFVVCDGVAARDVALLVVVVVVVSLEAGGAGCAQPASSETATSVIERAVNRIDCVARIMFLEDEDRDALSEDALHHKRCFHSASVAARCGLS
jgi:hypothetical protein